MTSISKKRKCRNTHYDRGGEKGKLQSKLHGKNRGKIY